MKSLCIEGWRNLSHSYSLVNQWQLLKLVDSKINLFHKDIVPYRDFWESKKNSGGLSYEQIKIISNVPLPHKGQSFEVVYRISFPLNIAASKSERLFVFGTSEFGITDGFFQGSSINDALSRGNLKIITPSHWSKIGFVKAGFKEENIKIIPHGVEPSSFFIKNLNDRSITRKSLGIHASDFVLINVGSLTRNKGVELLLSAFMFLRPKYPNLRLIVKDSSNLYRRNLMDVVKDMRNSDNFKHLDFNQLKGIITISKNLDIEQMNQIYNSSDAYVSPYFAEGFNLPPLEAAACGLPIVVTSGGSTDDYFSEKIGLKIDSKIYKNNTDESIQLVPDFDSLVDCIEKLINSSLEFGGEIGSKYVHETFNWKKITDLLITEIS